MKSYFGQYELPKLWLFLGAKLAPNTKHYDTLRCGYSDTYRNIYVTKDATDLGIKYSVDMKNVMAPLQYN